MSNKQQIIDAITQRIKDEHRKHGSLEWERIAAHKIYGSFFEDQEEKQDRACPCLYLEEPCSPQCTCKNKLSSHGCDNCCTYGSLDQRKENAIKLDQRRKKINEKN